MTVKRMNLLDTNRELRDELKTLQEENVLLSAENQRLCIEVTELRSESDRQSRELQIENGDLKLENKSLKDEIVQLHVQQQLNPASFLTTPKPQRAGASRPEQFSVKTNNRFGVLEPEDTNDGNKPDTDTTRTNSSMNTTKKQRQSPNSKFKAHEIQMVFDSHGNDLIANKIYKWRDVGIHILGKDKKNISGASEYVQGMSEVKHLVIGVGSNDLASTTTTVEAAVQSMSSLLQSVPPSTVIHVLPAFDRINEDVFNEKVQKFNTELMETTKKLKMYP